MRTIFFNLLKEKMKEDESLFLLVADMGLGLVEPFQEEFPDRFLNVGIAEQNMIGVASGLVNAGFRPVCYTITNFLTQRCYEQIRNDICLHKYPITLVGNATGFDNGLLGPTHQVIDDVGCIKVLPNISIYSPSSLSAMKMVFDDVMQKKEPAFIRIGKSSFDIDIPTGKVNYLATENKESDILLIVHGTILENCVKAANLTNGFSIYCMNRIKPLDKKEIGELFNKYPKIVVVEDHFITSGLYNSLCQLLAETPEPKTRIYCIGVKEEFESAVGDKDYFAQKYGYSPEKITEFISKLK